jgi:O-antigen/teichoic acid export membrane protein
MITAVKNLSRDFLPSYLKSKMKGLMVWGRLISITGSAQVLVQILGLLSGILIIRLLSTQEFALYTLANSMLATTIVLADSGIGAGIMASGGKVWQNPRALGSVITTGVQLRRRFSLFTIVVALPILLYLLLRHDANWGMAVLIALVLIPAFYASLSDTLYEVPLKLNQDIGALQKNQLLANLSRFILLISSLYFFPLTIVAMVCTGVTRLCANISLRKRATRFADLDQPADKAVNTEITGMLKRTMPSTVYYCVSSQITIWLISIFGNTTSIAQVGALERIVGMVSLVGVLFTTLVIPRFARLPMESGLLISWFLKIIMLLIVVSTGICCVLYFCSEQVLLLLGPKYRNLQHALLLVAIAGCLKLMAGIANYLSVSRGWAISPALYIIVSLVVQVLMIVYMDLSLLSSILVISIVNGLVALLLYAAYFFYRGFGSKVVLYG